MRETNIRIWLEEKKTKKTTHNLKGCRCPEGSDIRFCLGEEPKPTTTIELTNEELEWLELLSHFRRQSGNIGATNYDKNGLYRQGGREVWYKRI